MGVPRGVDVGRVQVVQRKRKAPTKPRIRATIQERMATCQVTRNCVHINVTVVGLHEEFVLVPGLRYVQIQQIWLQ